MIILRVAYLVGNIPYMQYFTHSDIVKCLEMYKKNIGHFFCTLEILSKCYS